MNLRFLGIVLLHVSAKLEGRDLMTSVQIPSWENPTYITYEEEIQPLGYTSYGTTDTCSDISEKNDSLYGSSKYTNVTPNKPSPKKQQNNPMPVTSEARKLTITEKKLVQFIILEIILRTFKSVLNMHLRKTQSMAKVKSVAASLFSSLVSVGSSFWKEEMMIGKILSLSATRTFAAFVNFLL